MEIRSKTGRKAEVTMRSNSASKSLNSDGLVLMRISLELSLLSVYHASTRILETALETGDHESNSHILNKTYNAATFSFGLRVRSLYGSMASPHEALARLQEYGSSLNNQSDIEPISLEEETAYANRLNSSLQSIQHQINEHETALERVRDLRCSCPSLLG